MLAQVLWRQIIYAYKHDDKIERGSIPQGTLVFVASSTKDIATVIHDEMVLVIPVVSLSFLNSEDDMIPIEELRKRYHNNRNTPCLLK